MNANNIFEKAKTSGRSLAPPSRLERFDQHRVWGYLLDVSVPLFAAGAVISATQKDCGVVVVAFAVLGLIAEALVIGARSQRNRSEITKTVRRCKAFIDVLHSHLLSGVADLRVTLLLPYREEKTHVDYLRPFLRNGDHPNGGRVLRVNLPQKTSEGVAGRAWVTGETLEAAFPKRYEQCSDAAERQAYCDVMHAEPGLLDRVGTGRNPKYVFACVLRHGPAKERVGVLCIDGLASTNIMATEDLLTNMDRRNPMFVQAQVVTGLVVSYGEELAHLVGRLHATCGALNDADP